MKGKFVGLIMLFLVSILAVNIASALPTIYEIQIDGSSILPGESIEVERGEELILK